MIRTLLRATFALGLATCVVGLAGAATPAEPQPAVRPVLDQRAPAPPARALRVREGPRETGQPRGGVNADAGVPPSGVPIETMHA